MNQIEAVLTSKLSQRGEKLTDTQRITVMECMQAYAILAVEKMIEKRNKETLIESVGFFSSIYKGEFRLWIRKQFFLRAKRQAMIRAEVENRKVYCIRAGEFRYELLSTKDVDLNKKLRILGKDLDAVKLHSVADFIAYPKR